MSSSLSLECYEIFPELYEDLFENDLNKTKYDEISPLSLKILLPECSCSESFPRKQDKRYTILSILKERAHYFFAKNNGGGKYGVE